jgi:hypothetical protein
MRHRRSLPTATLLLGSGSCIRGPDEIALEINGQGDYAAGDRSHGRAPMTDESQSPRDVPAGAACRKSKSAGPERSTQARASARRSESLRASTVLAFSASSTICAVAAQQCAVQLGGPCWVELDKECRTSAIADAGRAVPSRDGDVSGLSLVRQ